MGAAAWRGVEQRPFAASSSAEAAARAARVGGASCGAVGGVTDLHDEARSDDGRDAELHQRAAVAREEHTHPIERIGRLVRLAAINRDLAADEEDEEGDRRPQNLLLRARI